ncbi:hypothetical protein EsDP_00002138 [Epichloe bromicola]|uniref:Uncharacterized protein n=1 Tax=Epichloe bromicola TaxID=79588 RepID=A0ABQ0CJW1_9HYPO
MYFAKLFSVAFGLSLLAISVAAPQLGRSKIPKAESNLHARDYQLEDEKNDVLPRDYQNLGDDKNSINTRDDDEIQGDDKKYIDTRGLICCTQFVPSGSVCDETC